MIEGESGTLKGCKMEEVCADLTCVLTGFIIALMRDGCAPKDMLTMFKFTIKEPFVTIDKSGKHMEEYKAIVEALKACIEGLIAVPA